jgi:hypothetical protein
VVSILIFLAILILSILDMLRWVCVYHNSKPTSNVLSSACLSLQLPSRWVFSAVRPRVCSVRWTLSLFSSHTRWPSLPVLLKAVSTVCLNAFCCYPSLGSRQCYPAGSDSVLLCPQMNVFLYILASRASCTLRRHGFDKKEPPVWVP